MARSRKFRAETCRKLASSRAKSIVKFGPDRKESQGRGDRAMDHISGIPSCDKLLPSLTHPHARSQNIETWPCIPYYLNLSSGACPASAPRTLTSPQVFGSSVWDKDKRAWIPQSFQVGPDMQFMLPSDYQLHYKPSPVRHILPRHQAAAMMDVVMEGCFKMAIHA